MLNYHNINDIEGKVSENLIDMYNKDYGNMAVSSIIAGFHRAYGLLDEGIMMSLEIIDSISDDTENLFERSILVWNLYVISMEFTEDMEYDKALEMLNRAEKNWSRNVVLGDEIGVYHVSWIEQIWNKKAEIYLLINDEENFQRITDKIINSRFLFFEKANDVTGELIFNDRCLYNCFEIMAIERRNKDIKTALSLIKHAVLIKAGNKLTEKIKKINACKNYEEAFKFYYRCYSNLPDYPYDNFEYSYCSSCKYFDNDKCHKFNISTDKYRACENYCSKMCGANDLESTK